MVNEEIKPLFTNVAEREHESLVNDLMSIRPCNPRLMNKLYSLSNIGLQEKWVSKFASTRSIQQTAFNRWSSELDVIMEVRRLENRYSLYLQRKPAENLEKLVNADCITVYTQHLREQAWGIAIEGITMPPQQEQVTLCAWDTLTADQACRAILVSEQRKSDLHKMTSRGMYTPYFGSLTQIRARRATLQVIEVSSIVTSLKSLLELRSWVKGNDPLIGFIDVLIAEKTTLPTNVLEKYTRQVYSGAISHRLGCMALRRGGMANQNLNHSSFYTITSDTAILYAKGGKNYTICFQSVFLHGLSLHAHRTELQHQTPRKTALLFTCNTCTWLLPPETFDMDSHHYQGVQLLTRIEELHHKDLHERFLLSTTVSDELSYSVIMGRKFAAWIINRRVIDKITTLDNRAIEEDLTLSFVNLAEFCRLLVGPFFKSFVFYCAIYDPLFMQHRVDYYQGVLEGYTKNPYDLMIDNLRRCGHLRNVIALQGCVGKPVYTPYELRHLVYNILSEYSDDLPTIFKEAYILTPEDPLHITIKAMILWLNVNSVEDLGSLHTRMTQEELNSALSQNYASYQIHPRITLAEEETIYRIRERTPPENLSAHGTICIYPPVSPPLAQAEGRMRGMRIMTITHESVAYTALAEIATLPTFLGHVGGRRLVTQNDPEGLGYNILYHTWKLQPGYPHWPDNEVWEREPYGIMTDQCPVGWTREEYIRNGPRIFPDVGKHALVVSCCEEIPPVVNESDALLLWKTRNRTVPYHILETFRCHCFHAAEEYWVLCTTQKVQSLQNLEFTSCAHVFSCESALITTEIDYLLKNRSNPAALKKEHRALLDALKKDNPKTLSSDGFFAWAFEHWEDFRGRMSTAAAFTTAIRIAAEATRISVLDYTGLHHVPEITPSKELINLYRVKAEYDRVICDITFTTSFHQDYTLGRWKGQTFGNLHLIWNTPYTCYLITHSHFVGLRDAFNSWFDVLLYSHLCPDKYPGYNLPQEISSVLQAGREVIIGFKTRAYGLLKLWPSLVISSILRDTESKLTFHKALVKEVTQYHGTKLFEIMTRRIPTNQAAHLALEMSGLWKCFGHPDINMDTSVAAWIRKGAAGKTGLDSAAHAISNAFRLEFCRQYYKTHHKWPTVRVDQSVPGQIKTNLYNNTWEERPRDPWTPEDFAGIRFEKNLDFNYHIDVADLLSDKSIIPELGQWIYEYDQQAHRTHHGFFPTGPPPSSKSVIVHYLQQEKVTVKEVIDQVESGHIPVSWRVMVAVPKEREFKGEEARCYGKMNFQMRLYQTVTEKNIADGVFKYIRHQSMTMSEEQLTRTINRMNAPMLEIEGETYVFITLDFSSWCLNFRLELLRPLLRDLDDLHGFVNVYQFTHIFPLISYLLFQDRFNPPRQSATGNPEEGPRCYFGPEAWLEGLRQKGWTLATILLILIVSWSCGTSASLLGQGDNQVILLRIPPSSFLEEKGMTTEEYIQYFLETLKVWCEKAGIVIKLEETWHSRNLFEYSRKYHYKGSQVSGALKRISRLASEANQVIPSLTGELAGIMSTGAAAAAEDATPVAAYFCAILEAGLRLRQANKWLQTEKWEVTCCLLLLTRNVGGYPLTIYSQFCTRAVQDVLSSNLHLIRTCLRDRTLGPYISKHVTLKTVRCET